MITTTKSSPTKALQAKSIKAAKYFLSQIGCTILEQGWKCDAGTADFIASDEDTLVFIDVKAFDKSCSRFPEDKISKSERNRRERIAIEYLAQHNAPSASVRFDIVSLVLMGDSKAFLRHHKDALG